MGQPGRAERTVGCLYLGSQAAPGAVLAGSLREAVIALSSVVALLLNQRPSFPIYKRGWSSVFLGDLACVVESTGAMCTSNTVTHSCRRVNAYRVPSVSSVTADLPFVLVRNPVTRPLMCPWIHPFCSVHPTPSLPWP